MSQYEFESARWCRSMAKAYHARKDFDTASTFRTVAEEIDNTRAELAALKDAAKWVVEQTRYITFNTTAYNQVSTQLVSEHMENLDALAALVGEE